MQAIIIILIVAAILAIICYLMSSKTENYSGKTLIHKYLEKMSKQLAINAAAEMDMSKEQAKFLDAVNTHHKKLAPAFEKCPLYKENPQFFVATFVFGGVAKGMHPSDLSGDISELIEETCKIMYTLK